MGIIEGGFPISRMIGRYLSRWTVDDDGVLFIATQAREYWCGPDIDPRWTWKFEHEQDCCESVRIVRLVSGIDGEYPTTITDARIWTWSDETPDDLGVGQRGQHESYTWTRLIVTTADGSLEVVWLGESNGYYNEGITVYGPDDERVGFEGE